MRILLTNDDGIESPGLHALAIGLHERDHEIIVVAPREDMSGVGAAIGRIRADQRIERSPPQCPARPSCLRIDRRPPGPRGDGGVPGSVRRSADLVVTGVTPARTW